MDTVLLTALLLIPISVCVELIFTQSSKSGPPTMTAFRLWKHSLASRALDFKPNSAL